jgi:F0F1-type ATP synthase assembly protein I
MVVASFLFLWLGYKLDQYLGTEPNFMLGLFMLAIFICVTRLYQEAKQRMKDI